MAHMTDFERKLVDKLARIVKLLRRLAVAAEKIAETGPPPDWPATAEFRVGPPEPETIPD